MFRKSLFFAVFVFPFVFTSNGQSLHATSPQSSDIISSFKHLSPQELLDIGCNFRKRNSFDTAFVLYNMVINTPSNGATVEQLIEAYNRSAVINVLHLFDYRTAYEQWIKALLLSESSGYTVRIPMIYYNLSTIYSRFDRDDIARSYNTKALELSTDSTNLVFMLAAQGIMEPNIDSAFYFLNRSLELSKKQDNFFLDWILHNFANLYNRKNNFDSTYHYYQRSLEETYKTNDIQLRSRNLSSLAKLFSEINQIDSALFYIDLSNAVATQHNLLDILADNYLILYEIDKSKGRSAAALKHYERYVQLRNSLLNTERLSEINQLQRLYDATKTNQQIEQLVIEQKVKDRTIFLHQLILYIISGVLLIVGALFVFIFLQNRKLNTAHNVLFEKNVKLMEHSKHFSEKEEILEQRRKKGITQELQDVLLDKILTLMEDTSVVCDPEFSLEKLAKLTNSNQTYVSQTINAALNKNFRSFLNAYRIKEAQRLLSDYDKTKYSIDSIAVKVGFKSPGTFYSVFKEITGISPSFYLDSLRKL